PARSCSCSSAAPGGSGRKGAPMPAENGGVQRLAWVTDPHLNFLAPDGVAEFCADLAAAGPDAVLVGGDIGEAPNLEHYLRVLDWSVECPVYFVLGNHDFYRGSVRDVRARVAELARGSPRLR